MGRERPGCEAQGLSGANQRGRPRYVASGRPVPRRGLNRFVRALNHCRRRGVDDFQVVGLDQRPDAERFAWLVKLDFNKFRGAPDASHNADFAAFEPEHGNSLIQANSIMACWVIHDTSPVVQPGVGHSLDIGTRIDFVVLWPPLRVGQLTTQIV